MSTEVIPTMTLGERVAAEIRAEMGRRKMSGRELARRLDRSPNWVSLMTGGVRKIDLDDLEAIAGALGLRASDLVLRAADATRSYRDLGHSAGPGAPIIPRPRSPLAAVSRPPARADSRHPPPSGVRRTAPVRPRVPQ